MANARWFLRYLKPVWGLIVVVVVTSLIASLGRLPISFLPKVLTESLERTSFPFGLSQGGYLTMYLGLVLAAMIAAHLLMILNGYCANRAGEQLMRTIRSDLFARLEKLSMLSVYARGAGQFVQRIARDVYMIRNLFNQTFTELVTAVLRGSVYLAALLWLDALLTVILLAAFLIVLPAVRYVNRRVERLARRTQQLGEEILAQLVESISGFRDILASGRFDRFARRFTGLAVDAERVGVRTAVWGQLGGLLPAILVGILILIPYYLKVRGGQLTAGDIGTVITYVGLMMEVFPVAQMFVRGTSELALSAPSMREVRAILDEGYQPEQGPDMPPEPAGQQPPPQRTRRVDLPLRSIRFEDVSLLLGGKPIVEDISFEIPGGKLTAVVGQSGAGKTTIFHLLLRLLEPSRGTIWINDVPLAEVAEEDLRRLVGFIPQNPFIFNQSLRENLLVGVPAGAGDEASDEALPRVVEMAQLTPLIESRRGEGGLDSSAGYMGARLSGGERQRVALGRLLLQDPQVIIGDEYTANIDVKTAKLIHEMMRTQFADRTRVVITHELYTVRGADHIVVLDHGRVVQTGKHEELLSRPGLYRELWEVQALE